MPATPESHYEYQVGGSLKTNAPSYVERQADSDLYHALIQGELCYVFNSRQMGKSSLRLRTKHRLEQSGMICASIDMTRIGSKNITPDQWYKGIVTDLLRGFNLLEQVNLKAWWSERHDLSLIQRLSQFIEEILLPQVQSERFFIFVDEIDSLLSLDFSADDFFALIRYCYNQRAENPAYNRLNWALFGVATPSDLIQNPLLTPFNIGRAINLGGFTLAEAQPLLAGLEGTVSNPQAVLREILAWTGGQPFLTQKLCRIAAESRSSESERIRETGSGATEIGYRLDYQLPIANPHLIEFYYKLPVLMIEKLVQSRIIDHWEAQDEPEHLKTIRNRLLHDQHFQARLELYLKILRGIEVVVDDSSEQLDLLLSGLVMRDQGCLRVFNRIYQEVFNQAWVEKQLTLLCPYASALAAWLGSDRQNDSHLLQGDQLQEAQTWATRHPVSELDYQFLIASQVKQVQQQVQQQWQQINASLTTMPTALEGHSPTESAYQITNDFASISHELRTPLNAILGFTQLMARDHSLTPTQQENLAMINHSSECLRTLIDSVLPPCEPNALTQTKPPQRRVIGLEPGQSYRILVVEDDWTNRKWLVKLLTALGFEVRESSNGQEAIGIWQTWKPHLIWMDIQMPVLDGYAAMQQIKADSKGQATVIIALTASPQEHNVQEDHGIRTAEWNDFVLKPTQETVIFEKMAQHLGVRYVYDEPDLDPGSQANFPQVLSSDMLAIMPLEWISQLHQAALHTNEQQIFELLAQISESHAAIAAALSDLVYNFRCDQIMDLTQPLLQNSR